MSTNKIIAELDAEQMNREIPEFAPGDTVVVQVRVKEGNRERLQAFEGVCIGKRNRGLNSAFTVRKISHGVGVERTFQTYSPLVDSITVKVVAMSDRPSFIISVSCPGKRRASRRSCPLNALVWANSPAPSHFFRGPLSEHCFSAQLVTVEKVASLWVAPKAWR